MIPERTRDMSLFQLRSIEGISDFDPGEGYKNNPNAECYVFVTDPDPASKFYFAIRKIEYINQDRKTYYTLDYKPHNSYSSGVNQAVIPSEQLYEFYNVWKKLVEEYSRLIPKQPQHDPILEQYEEEFYNDFEMVDDDANTHPFSTNTQKQIDRYLDVIIKRLENYKEKVSDNESVKAELDEIIGEATNLQETQTRQTKNQVAKKFASILAKCKKIGFKVLEQIQSELVKYLVKGALEDSDGVVDSFNQFIELIN